MDRQVGNHDDSMAPINVSTSKTVKTWILDTLFTVIEDATGPFKTTKNTKIVEEARVTPESQNPTTLDTRQIHRITGKTFELSTQDTRSQRSEDQKPNVNTSACNGRANPNFCGTTKRTSTANNPFFC